MQLFWILSGFLLMAYLAFKVFPKSKSQGRNGNEPGAEPEKYSGIGSRNLMIAGNYRLESFPHATLSSAKIIEFQSIIFEPNRRLS
jgi:hypothetical protein